jgi:hypothetical protein
MATKLPCDEIGSLQRREIRGVTERDSAYAIVVEDLLIALDHSQRPFNSATEAVLLEMGTQRIRPNDPQEPVFARRYWEPDKFFLPRASGAPKRFSGRPATMTKLPGWMVFRGTD